MQAVVIGQAGSGLAISLLAMVTVWLSPPDPSRLPEPRDLRGAAVAYFVGAAAIMVATLIAYLLLPSLEFVQHHVLLPGGRLLQQLAPLACMLPAGGTLTVLACQPARRRARAYAALPQAGQGAAVLQSDTFPNT